MFASLGSQWKTVGLERRGKGNHVKMLYIVFINAEIYIILKCKGRGEMAEFWGLRGPGIQDMMEGDVHN